ncbi:hypothetical protein AB1Y20_019582 [Prymnesium parvum]|uniref:Uncharacterized protein n=1 Tax=Prymnesium parvum TaxID=97485 RepID=A0AB34JUU5_PRYPA
MVLLPLDLNESYREGGPPWAPSWEGLPPAVSPSALRTSAGSRSGSRPDTAEALAPAPTDVVSRDVGLERAIAYWMERTPGDFRRSKKQRSRVPGGDVGIPLSKSLPSLGRAAKSDVTPNLIKLPSRSQKSMDAALENARRVAMRRGGQAALLEARRVRLEKELESVVEEYERLVQDEQNDAVDASSAGVTLGALEEEIDNLTTATQHFLAHQPTLELLIRRAARARRISEAKCAPLQEQVSRISSNCRRRYKSLGETRELVGRLETERKDLAARLELQRRRWSKTIELRREEMQESRADAEAVHQVRKKAIDKARYDLGDGDYEEEATLLRKQRSKGALGVLAGASLVFTKDYLDSLVASYAKLAMLFGPVDSADILADRVIEAFKNPRQTAREKIQGAIDQGRRRHDQLTAERQKCMDSLQQLRFTGESSNVGYLILSPRTGDILAYGGTPEVNELGKKCMAANKQKQTHLRRCEASTLLLAQVASCINGLFQLTSVGELQGGTPPAAIDQFINAEQVTTALEKVFQRLLKVALTVQASHGGSPMGTVPPNAPLSVIQDALARESFSVDRSSKRDTSIRRSRRGSIPSCGEDMPSHPPTPPLASSAEEPHELADEAGEQPPQLPPLPLHRRRSSTAGSEPGGRSRQLAPHSYNEAIRFALLQLSSQSFRLDEEADGFVAPLSETNTRIKLPKSAEEDGADADDDDDGDDGDDEDEVVVDDFVYDDFRTFRMQIKLGKTQLGKTQLGRKSVTKCAMSSSAPSCVCRRGSVQPPSSPPVDFDQLSESSTPSKQSASFSSRAPRASFACSSRQVRKPSVAMGKKRSKSQQFDAQVCVGAVRPASRAYRRGGALAAAVPEE